MKIIYFIIVALILSTNEARADVPDQRQCVRYDWKLLTTKLADKSISPSWRDGCGESMAALHLRYGAEDDALNYIARERTLNKSTEHFNDLLSTAVDGNFQRTVRTILEFSAPANASMKRYYSILLNKATFNGHLEIIRLLIKAGADVNYRAPKYEYQNILLNAILYGNTMIVNLLIDHGVAIDKYKQAEYNGNLIVFAIKSKNIQMVDLLYKLDFHLNVVDKYGNSPLHYAIDNAADETMIEYLLLHGADPCLKNSEGENAATMLARLKKQLNSSVSAITNYSGSFNNLCTKEN